MDRRQREEAERQVGALKEEKKKQVAAMEELRREVDIFINSFLKQEGVEADKQEWLRQLLDDVKALSEELVLATKEEREQRKAIAQLNGEREAKAREAAKAMGAARDTHEELKVKELTSYTPQNATPPSHSPHPPTRAPTPPPPSRPRAPRSLR